jgi:hypothetical protein
MGVVCNRAAFSGAASSAPAICIRVSLKLNLDRPRHRGDPSRPVEAADAGELLAGLPTIFSVSDQTSFSPD